MTKDEALKLALEALDLAQALLEKSSHHKKILTTYIAIREALAQPAREWVGLTDAEWSDLYEAHHDKYNLPKQQGSPDGMDYERAIEAKLKERNHD